MRERLDAVIPGYLISDKYAALHQEYFGVPRFWTPTRIYTAFGFGAAVALFLLALLYVQRQRQRQKMLDFAHQQRELEREQAHTETLGKVITELERSNRELDEFAYIASHDLKEPLRGIAINASFLAREQLSEKGNERVERMLLLAKRMEQLVSDLLFFSRLGRGEKVMKDVDTSHIVEGIEKELKEWMTERQGEIQCSADLPWIYAERSKVKTVFQNLIVNALKYNDSDTKTVQVGFSPEATANEMILHDVFWVRDNGIGIEDKNRDKIFRIFQRLNREELYGAGTGAGLSFVRRIIEKYGGTITFESDPESGTTFYFSMPLANIKTKSKKDLTGVKQHGQLSHDFDRRRQP
ncbi:ATP-binding protein [Phaeobacter sp. G2]|nr:ATP-binding protein [Phaeobacter sp. G2]